MEPIDASNTAPYNFPEVVNPQTMSNQVHANMQRGQPITTGDIDSFGTLDNGGLQSQDSFGSWINQIMSDSLCSVDESTHDSSVSSAQESYSSLVVDNHPSSLPEQVFSITNVSPGWASSTEKTKVSFCHYHKIYLVVITLL